MHQQVSVEHLHIIDVGQLFFPWAKWPPFGRRHFQMHCFDWKTRISINNSLKFVPKSPINNTPAFGSDNGLAPTTRQAIIWTNVDPIHWRIYAALGVDGCQWNIAQEILIKGFI